MAASERTEREELAGVLEDLRGHLVWLGENGVDAVPAPPRPPAAAQPAAAAATRSPRPAASEDAAPGAVRSLRDAVRAAAGVPASRGRHVAAAPAPAASAVTAVGAGGPRTLEQVRAELGDCTRCRLSAGRQHLVFGEGDPKAELVFVGEGPSVEDDQSGSPFSGPAGELLTKMIEAMGYARSQVYLCNLVKCRLPDNRAPQPDETAACEPFLAAQLAAIQPRAIVALGKVATHALLREQTPISELRGNWREYRGIRLMPTFHPAYLLRSPAEKRKVWEDLKLVMKELGHSSPAGGR